MRNATRCREVTSNWIDKEFHVGSVRLRRHALNDEQHSFFGRLANTIVQQNRNNKHVVVSSDQRTGLVVDKVNDSYLFNARWTKVERNTSRQHLVYTQFNANEHTV
jgi:hypothetical protein